MKLAIERLLSSPGINTSSWGRVGLLANQASTTQDLTASWKVVRKIFDSKLVAFFSPQHGFYADVQDNMIETRHQIHKPTGLPIHSLYSETREPTTSMLEHVDTILIDLQHTGCRVYTFKYTVANCLRAAKTLNKKVVVLDRPNPVGGEVIEGCVLKKPATSFVGQFGIPMRHAMTLGECAHFFNQEIGANLDVIEMLDWLPQQIWDPHRVWVPTSPNLPHSETVQIYPGTVLIEGTNLSEGRGTALPFQLIGAPFITDAAAYVKRVEDLCDHRIEGIKLRPVSFQPHFQKWKGEFCHGLQIHIRQNTIVKGAYRLGLALMRAAFEMAPNEFSWSQPPYEYEYERQPIDLITGTLGFAEEFLKSSINLNDEQWSAGIQDYRTRASKFFLYDRETTIYA